MAGRLTYQSPRPACLCPKAMVGARLQTPILQPPTELRIAELRAQRATLERENAERIARMCLAELYAQIEVEMARSNATHSSRAPSNNNGARPSLHAGSRATARADATQLHAHNLQVVMSDPLLPITLQNSRRGRTDRRQRHFADQLSFRCCCG